MAIVLFFLSSERAQRLILSGETIMHFASATKRPRVHARNLLIGGSFALISGLASANLLSNGSFEAPIVPVGGGTSFGVGSNLITGWTVFGPAGTSVTLLNTLFTQFGVSFPAQDGNQWLDLTGVSVNQPDGVSQTVATIIGDQYQLTYFIGNTTGGGIFGTTSTVDALLNGTPTFSDTNSTVNPTTLSWSQFSHTFIATTASTTLGFRNADPINDTSNGLDNIVLLDLGPAVVGVPGLPEPSLLALFGIGMIGLGLSRRRKAK
jgi:hypothetical protein